MIERLRGYGEGLEETTPSQHIETDENPRCYKCEKLLAEKVSRPWVIQCSRCKSKNRGMPAHFLPGVTTNHPGDSVR